MELVLKSRPLIVFLINLVIVIVFSFMNKYFLTVPNIKAIGFGMLSVGIISMGMMIVMVTGAFDLSVGSTLALTGVIVAKLMEFGVPIVLSILIALTLGAFIGFFNGFLITEIGINPFIATLGTMSMVRGLALAITQGMPVYGLPKSFAWLGEGSILGFPFALLLMLILVVVFDQLLRRTVVGRLFYYTGGNEEAARLSGINTKRVRMASFIVVGFLAAFAGVILASRMMSMAATSGTGIELKAIAACIIGGAALGGGEGTIIGAFLGTLLVAFIDNILILSGVSAYWQLFSAGAILVAVVSLDLIVRRFQKGK
ncbi:MAG: ABC transporter permease [Candidatus Humimicrobiaceae bacterium]